jgi:PAS domain-containing protein
MNRDDHDFTDARTLRKLAEDLLKEKQRKAELPSVEADVKKLLHELQVHQIELEMQNDELLRAYETAESALRKYTMLYDLAPMGYITLKSDGTISELNFTAAEMLGEKRFSLINSKFKLFISDESKPVFNKFFTNVFSRNAKESCEVMLGYDGAPLSKVYIEGVIAGDEHECLLSIVDTSNFKK